MCLFWLFHFHQESDSSGSTSDDIAEKLQALTVAHDTTYVASSETASTASSDDDDQQRSKLNGFLVSCKIKPLVTSLEWSSASESTRKRYVNHAADAVVGLLKVLSPENASHLWEALQLQE